MDPDRPLRLVVVAPGPKARRRLRSLLDAVPAVEVVGEAADARSAALIAAGFHPDAVLLATPTTEKESTWVFPALLRMAPAVPVLLTPLELWFPEDRAGAPDVRRFAEVLRLAWTGGAQQVEGDDLAVLAHDLVTPAASVIGLSELLLRYWDRFEEAERRKALENIARLGRELARLVERLVRSGAGEGGELVGDRRLRDIAPLVEEAIEQVRSSAPEHRFEVSVARSLPRAKVDGSAVVEAVANYLSNAAKHAPPSSAVRVEAVASEGEVRITVADQGPGIDPEDQRRLFQKFSRVPGNGTVGHGLGLFIARTIAEAHGGRVWVESRPGEGATFGIAFPAAPAPPRARRRRAHVAARH
jgi:signal transduction histidine kinase